MVRFFPSRTVAVELLRFPVRWYGLLYLLGFIVAWFLLPRLERLRNLRLTADNWSSLLAAAVLGVIVGGRLGYVLFFQPSYYALHPMEILAVWKGGMSSHGGFIGVTVALLFALRCRTREEILRIADVVVVPVAIGLALGRIGNLINQELYGTVTPLPWGIAIPGVEGLRHPTAIYAFLKDLLIAGVCFVYLWRTRQHFVAGRALALFLMLYGALRFLVEFFREQTTAPIDVGIMISRGQLLTVPIIVVGVWLWWSLKRAGKAGR